MAFDLQPTLEGDLIQLRPLRPSDADDLFAVACDPLIWAQHPAHDRYQREVFDALFRESLASQGALAAIDRKSGNIIGSSRFHAYNESTSKVDIGWSFPARVLGRQIQQRNETADVAACVSLRQARGLRYWNREPSFPEGD